MNISPIERLAGAGRLDRIFVGGEWVAALRAGAQRRHRPVDGRTGRGHRVGERPGRCEGRRRGAQRVRDLVRELPAEPGRAAGPRSRPGAGAGRVVCAGDLAGDGLRHQRRARRAGADCGAASARRARPRGAAIPFLTHRGSTAIVREPIGVCAPDHAVELAAVPDHRQGRARRSPRAAPWCSSRASCRRSPRCCSRRSCTMPARRRACSTSSTAPATEVGAAMADAPRRRHGLDHRLDPRRRAGGAGRRADRQARGAGARRQVAQRVPARCRFRAAPYQGRARPACATSASRAARRRGWWCRANASPRSRRSRAEAANGDRRRRSARRRDHARPARQRARSSPTCRS